MSATFLTSRRASSVLTAFLRDRDRYEARGFRVTDVHGDNEFNIQSFIDAIQPAKFHEYAKGEHVGVIENTVKFIKKRTRSVCHAAPYRKYTTLMTRFLIEGIIDILIFFHQKMAFQQTLVQTC